MGAENFINPETGEKHLISSYRTVHRDGEWINVDKNGERLNDKGVILVLIPKEGIPTFLKSNNKESLQKMLKKRSSDHFKKEIKDVKHEMNQKAIDGFKEASKG